jgi:hypothetical protein
MFMWFTVSLLIEGVHVGQPPSESLWEEQLVLIRAKDEAEAQQQGEAYGRAEEHEYISATGDLVRWHFRRVERVHAINAETLDSGTEVFSRFLRPEEVESLLTPFEE